MANPSTTGPSGAGTEVLRRVYGNAGAATTIPAGTDKIRTIISITWTSSQTGQQTISLRLQGDGSTEIELLREQDLQSNETFVWSDRLVMADADTLTADSTGNADILISYIEQEF